MKAKDILNDPTSLKELVEKQASSIASLEQRNIELEQLLKSSQETANQAISLDLSISAEEVICLKQLEMLKQNALTQELTLEEARKVEIFSKILNALRAKDLGTNSILKKASEKELITMLSDSDESSKH